MVAYDEEHGDRYDDREHRPGDLAHSPVIPARHPVGQVDAVDHGDAEAVEDRGDGQDQRVSVAGDDAEHDMQHENQNPEHPDLNQHARFEFAERTELHECDCAQIDADRDDE